MAPKKHVIKFRPSKHFTTHAKRKVGKVVLHYTATRRMETALQVMHARGVSAHIVVGREAGEIVCTVPHDKVAWHAVGSNSTGIGIEIVNLGGMIEKNGVYFQPNAKGRLYPVGPRVPVMLAKHPTIDAPYNAWERFTDWQYEAVAQVCRWCLDRYGLDVADVVGHESVDPRGMKTDPGPAFDWSRLRTLIENAKMDGKKPLAAVVFGDDGKPAAKKPAAKKAPAAKPAAVLLSKPAAEPAKG